MCDGSLQIWQSVYRDHSVIFVLKGNPESLVMGGRVKLPQILKLSKNINMILFQHYSCEQ